MDKDTNWFSSSHLWDKIKPLARQMRHEPTPTEERLWEYLRNRQVSGLKFRRQHAVGPFILDFYCSEACLAIEVDGSVHEYTVEEDALRQEFLENLGFKVLRFTNQEVLESLDTVIDRIKSAITNSITSDSSPSLRRGEGARG